MMLFSSFVIISLWKSVATDSTSSLRGSHLTIGASNYPVAITTERNSTGYIIGMTGVSPLMLDWMSSRFGFTYTVLQTNSKGFDGTANSPGLRQDLIDGKCDLVMGVIGQLYSRLAFMDFSQGYAYTANGFMIPMPQAENNFSAAIKPFQLPVWIGLILGILSVSFILYLSPRFPRKREGKIIPKTQKSLKKNSRNVAYPRSFPRSFYQIYVLEVLLNQGSNCPDKKLAFRVIAGTWCLACFVLVTAYNSVLVSFVTSPNAVPLISSIHDLKNSSAIHLVVDKGMAYDVTFSTATGGIFKQLGDKLRNNKNSRCTSTDICVNRVKSGGTVYVNTIPAIHQAMMSDLKTTGKCNLAVAKELEYAFPWAWGLTKNGRLNEAINRGILEMRAAGLVDVWMKWYQPDVRQCLEQADKIQRRSRSTDDKPTISLKDLTSAFAVLIAGYLCSILAFLVEKIVYFMHLKT